MRFLTYLTMCVALLVAGPAQAEKVLKINQSFIGATLGAGSMDTNDDGIYASSVSFQMFGSPGRSTAVAVAEFIDFEYVGLPGCDLRAEMVMDSYVQAFNDGSMLFNWATEGFNCLDLSTSEVWGKIEGVVTGGTGRFAGATGEFVVEFDAYAATPVQNAFTGTIEGSIVVP